jgi:hypothetical protein
MNPSMAALVSIEQTERPDIARKNLLGLQKVNLLLHGIHFLFSVFLS